MKLTMINIDNVMLTHLAWKVKLRDFIDGQGDMTGEEVRSYKDCELGQWLYSDKLTKYSSRPDITELKKSHKELHESASLVFSIMKTKNIQSARKEMLKLDLISYKVFALLLSLPKTIR